MAPSKNLAWLLQLLDFFQPLYEYIYAYVDVSKLVVKNEIILCLRSTFFYEKKFNKMKIRM